MKRLICLFLLCTSSLAGAGAPDNYLDTIPVFWRTLYPEGGRGLYCNDRFARYDRRYNIEHVYPMAWVARELRCGKRKQCRASSPRFNRIEADMHNMYPARRDLNKQRGAKAFAELRGEERVEPGCDLEINDSRRRVEPRPASRGNIARAMLYMSERYDLPLYESQRRLFMRWHKDDPVDAEERRRNARIRRVQGQGNPWVDK